MTLDKLIEVVDEGYSDGLISSYHAEPEGEFGDSLAQAIAREIASTYSDKGSDADQIETAIDALEVCQRDIDGCLSSLKEALQEIAEAKTAADFGPVK